MLKGQNSRSGVKWKYAFCKGDKHTYTFDLMRHTLTLANQSSNCSVCRLANVQISQDTVQFLGATVPPFGIRRWSRIPQSPLQQNPRSIC